ncbi:MAG: hypothetical protein MI784_04440, partial [Cytophagales bacterium]|nr:hypothetical protein [Cytophagales bacterium]
MKNNISVVKGSTPSISFTGGTDKDTATEFIAGCVGGTAQVVASMDTASNPGTWDLELNEGYNYSAQGNGLTAGEYVYTLSNGGVCANKTATVTVKDPPEVSLNWDFYDDAKQSCYRTPLPGKLTISNKGNASVNGLKLRYNSEEYLFKDTDIFFDNKGKAELSISNQFRKVGANGEGEYFFEIQRTCGSQTKPINSSKITISGPASQLKAKADNDNIVSPSVYGAKDGQITFEPEGGNPDKQWAPELYKAGAEPALQSKVAAAKGEVTFENLAAGIYYVKNAKDYCEIQKSETAVTSPQEPALKDVNPIIQTAYNSDDGTTYYIRKNGGSEPLTVNLDTAQKKVLAILENSGGKELYRQEGKTNAQRQFNFHVAAGDYYLRIFEDREKTKDYSLSKYPGYKFNTQIVMNQPDPLTLSVVPNIYAVHGFPIKCHGGAASVNVTVKGGIKNYTLTVEKDNVEFYRKNNISTEEPFWENNRFPAGTYTFTVTDKYGTSVSQDLTLAQPQKTQADFKAKLFPSGEAIDCFGNNSGELKLTGSDPGWTGIAGKADDALTYALEKKKGNSWEKVGNDYESLAKGGIISGLPAGIYRIQHTNKAGCERLAGFGQKTGENQSTDPQKTIELKQPAKLTAEYVGTVLPTCSESSDGKIRLNIQGGSPNKHGHYKV